MAQRIVNGYAVIAHRPASANSEGIVILASVPRVSGGYEYVVATMNSLAQDHWFSGFYTDNLVNGINRYYER